MKKPQYGRWHHRQRNVMQTNPIHKAVADAIFTLIGNAPGDAIFHRHDVLNPLYVPGAPLDKKGQPITDFRGVVIQWDSVQDYLKDTYAIKLISLCDYAFSSERVADEARGTLTEGEIARKCMAGGRGKETVGYAWIGSSSDSMIVIAHLWRKEQCLMGINAELRERVQAIRAVPALAQQVFVGKSKGLPAPPVPLKLSYKP